MAQLFGKMLTAAGGWTVRPVAFAVLIVYAISWIVFDRASLNFHGATALITLAMTLLIQRAEHRDTQALHAKLDELLHAQGAAQQNLTRIDEDEPEEIERHRDRARQRD